MKLSNKFVGCLILTFAFTGCSSLLVDTTEQVEIKKFSPQKPVNIALVLGGGGSKGLAHLGAIQELEKEGIRPDLIIGCSAGAFAGALYADQPDLEASIEALLPLKRKDVLDYSYLNPTLGVVNGDLLQSLIQRLLQATYFEELKIPLIVVTTDLISGSPVEISSGEISSAVRASCAVPGVFKPVTIYGRHCVDGGASCPLPVSIAKKYGAKIVIAIDLSEKLPEEAPKHLFGITRRSLEIAYRNFVKYSLTQADIPIQMDFDDLGMFNDDSNLFLYEKGKEVVRNKLPEIKSKLSLLQLNFPTKFLEE